AGQRQIGRERRTLVAALFLDDLNQHHLAALDDFLNLVLAARAERAFRHFLQHVVATDGFDDFLFGVLGVVLIFMAVVAFGSRGEFVGRSKGVPFTGVLDMRRVVGMGRVFALLFLVTLLVMGVFGMGVFGRRLGDGRFDRRHGGRAGFLDRCFARGICPFVRTLRVVVVRIVIVRMVVIVTMRLVIMRIMVVVRGILMMLGVVRMHFAGVRAFVLMRLAFIGLGRLRGVLAGVLDDVALDTVTMAAAAGVAVARAAAAVAGAVLALFLGLAVGALVGLDQRLTVGDRDLIVVRVDFAESQEAVAVAAIFDERRLQRRLYARDLGEIDIA